MRCVDRVFGGIGIESDWTSIPGQSRKPIDGAVENDMRWRVMVSLTIAAFEREVSANDGRLCNLGQTRLPDRLKVTTLDSTPHGGPPMRLSQLARPHGRADLLMGAA